MLRRPMNQLCDLGVSAVNHLAGLRWNLASPARRQQPAKDRSQGGSEGPHYRSASIPDRPPAG